LEVGPVADGSADEAARGFRYYRSAPFLLIYTDNAGGLHSKVLYLPDTTKKMSVRPYNYLSSNKATLVFDKGKLTQAKAEIDENAIPAAVLASLEKVAKELAKAQEKAKEEFTVPAPYLFRIRKTHGEWTLEGGQGSESIRVTPKQ
jgi:hypothetical protein